MASSSLLQTEMEGFCREATVKVGMDQFQADDQQQGFHISSRPKQCGTITEQVYIHCSI